MQSSPLAVSCLREDLDEDLDRAVRLGVEHELRVWRGRDQVDFRVLIGEVAPGLPTLDPGDPRARRLPSGAVLTADGREAEIATPPVRLSARAPRHLDDLLRAERTELRERTWVRGASALTGFSTHVNISVPDHRVVPVGHAFVRTCLAALAAVVEPADSQGMLVRPRRGRLEVCGEYVEGDDLVAGLTLLAACTRGLVDGGRPPSPATATRVVAAREKFGWYVEPSVPEDVAALDRVWAWARPFAEAQGLDLRVVDDLVDGARALRASRRDTPTGRCSFAARPSSPVARGPAVDTRPRVRDGVRAETEWLTWLHAVWVLRDPGGRACRAVVPVEREPQFLSSLDSGDLDQVVTRMLRRRRPARRLVVHAQVEPGLWHDVRPGALVPAERRPDGSVPRISARRARRALIRSRRGERQ